MTWAPIRVYRAVWIPHTLVIMTLDTDHPQSPPTGRQSAKPSRGGSASAPGPVRRNAPGLALALVGLGLAEGVHALLPAVPMLTAAVVLGVVAAHLPGVHPFVRGRGRAGLSMAGKRLMRAGIVLLGLKLSIGDVLGLGWATVTMVLGVVLVTFFGTWWLGRKLGLPGDQPLLIATGYSICGASAVSAVSSALGKEDDDEQLAADVATAVALVTLCGTLAIAILPLLHHPLGLDTVQFGRWVGSRRPRRRPGRGHRPDGRTDRARRGRDGQADPGGDARTAGRRGRCGLPAAGSRSGRMAYRRWAPAARP